MDVDETVLDNSLFQGQLVIDRTSYTTETWTAWVAQRRAAAVPGAVEFVRHAIGTGVRVFFVTNRSAGEEADTVANLRAVGIAATPESVLASGENGWTSDKTGRREHLAQTHRLVLLIGDDLGDFVGVANLGVPERLALVTTHASRWVDRWVLLPNPQYGSWERALYPGVSGDAEILAKKRSQVRGFAAAAASAVAN
jgi:acid phosphatase